MMKNFWPRRSVAKGFSIESLARKYREKISSRSSDGDFNKIESDKSLTSIRKEEKNILNSHHLLRKGHWANRDFSEYRDVA